MLQSRCTASSLVAITVFLAVGFAWGVEPDNGERWIVQHLWTGDQWSRGRASARYSGWLL